MKHYVITIARQFGSLGRPIAKKLSENLGIEFYDRDIVEETARKTGLSVSTISDKEESAHKSFLYMGYPLGMGKDNEQDQIFKNQVKIIRELADKESCIIVGRCSDYILKDREDVMHVFIYASYEQRMKNCINDLGMSEEEAKKMIAKVDKARDVYHKTYAGFLPGDFRYKDLMLDSGMLGVDGTAKAIADIANLKFKCIQK